MILASTNDQIMAHFYFDVTHCEFREDSMHGISRVEAKSYSQSKTVHLVPTNVAGIFFISYK